MIVDIDKAEPLSLAAHYDVCIAGAGVAGIVLAINLARRGRRVLLLEAGGFEFSEKSQSFYEGVSIGHAYFDLDVVRLRFLGGTSNHWNGWCRPLDDYDFEARNFIEGSGWPISILDVEPYLPEARDIMEISDFPDDTFLDGSDERLKEVHYRWSPPVRFGEKYRDFLAASDAVTLYLNANLVDIDLDPNSGRVAAFIFRSYADATVLHRVVADQYVLALGGIENARVLLNANRQMPQGIGNDNDLVGRFFMEHPHFGVGYCVLGQNSLGFGDTRRFVAPTRKLMREAGIANASYRILPIADATELGISDRAVSQVSDALCASDVVADFVRTVKPMKCPDLRGVMQLSVAAEQAPNASSRVMLSGAADRFGSRRAALDWQLTPFDKKTMRVGALEIAKYFARRDIGRVKLFDWVLDEHDPGIPGFGDGHEVAGRHHMGTTRMGTSKRDGVVDPNCRVFAVDNLYLAGSSVFRTAGHANPTLTIVQLALRLAEYLADRRPVAP